jgi:uncharacterized protein
MTSAFKKKTSLESNPMSFTHIKRRQFLTQATLGTVALASASITQAGLGGTLSQDRKRRAGLMEPAFRPMPLGSIRPEGWLQRQLRIQADGLSGHLDEFWPDVGQSQWFGGKAEGWERAPYWLDGVIPLAWVLGDAKLKAKVKSHIDHIVAHQRPDGWYAPYPADASAKSYDLWAILLANKMLVQYHEATGDAAVFQAVVKNLRATLAALDRTPLFGWGQYRWYEGLVAVYYVYERTGESWLLDLAGKLHAQGFDYRAFYRAQDIVSPTPRRGRWNWAKHVVNTAMAIKAYGMSWRLTRRADDLSFPGEMLAILDRYHGQVTGMFTGDECLAGRSPTQGTELCAVVEALYSLELLLSMAGDPAYGDRLERIAYNALPAAFAPDMWSHQYDQQVNQVQCTVNPNHMWSSNGPDSNIFGLEPNYGCCTANLHQGWPKFAAHLWMRTPEGGIAAMAYAPSTAQFEVQGTPVSVTLETDYPFREKLKVRVATPKAVRFPLVLRVPGWAAGATVSVSDGATKPMKPGSFHRINRTWQNGVELELHFPMQAKITRRYNQAVAVERGPLVYSLKLDESRTRINEDKPHRELPHADFEVQPASPWNYGLVTDPSRPETSVKFTERPVGLKPFSPEGAGMVGQAKGRLLTDWKLEHGWAGEIPPEPQTSNEPLEDLVLIPYGCTNIRITEFPALKK